MALADRAELVARLSLKDDFSGKVKGVEGKMRGLGKAAGRAGKAISIGLGAGLAVGAGVTIKAVRSGLDSLAELESATTSVDAAIKQMGLTGKVTSGQIATWANEIEAAVGAAFDDKAITQAATNLIRYGKITTSNLRPALVVMTDLAAKTGSVEGASTLLGKALADPTKAAGKLARVGIILTKQQQKQIKAMTEAGDAAGAQKVLLDALTVSTKGAAAASQGPYQRSIATLQDAWEDATKALAVGFLPVLEEVRDILSKELAKPGTLDRIRDFGKGLAGGLKGLIDAAKNVPWDQVGDAMKLAGTGAKAMYDAFTSLPPWVQTAVLTGWGLNKLSGGLLSGVVGELGKGLVKGVLGMNAGVVNINAGTVNGAGGVGGAGKGGGVAGALGMGFTVGVVIEGVREGVNLLGNIESVLNANGDPKVITDAWRAAADDTHLIPQILRDGFKWLLDNVDPPAAPQGPGASVLDVRDNPLLDATRALQAKADRQRDAIENNNIATRAGLASTRAAIVSARIDQTAVSRTGDAAVVAAIRRSRPILNVRVNVSNSIRTTVYRTGTTINRTSTGVRGALLGA